MGNRTYLKYPSYIKKSLEGRKEAIGELRNRKIKTVFIELEKLYKDNNRDTKMKLEYDKDVDAAYIYLKDKINEGEVKKLLN